MNKERSGLQGSNSDTQCVPAYSRRIFRLRSYSQTSIGMGLMNVRGNLACAFIPFGGPLTSLHYASRCLAWRTLQRSAASKTTLSCVAVSWRHVATAGQSSGMLGIDAAQVRSLPAPAAGYDLPRMRPQSCERHSDTVPLVSGQAASVKPLPAAGGAACTHSTSQVLPC